MTLATLLATPCRERPSTIALVDGVRRWTYAELDALTDRLAAAWQRAGTCPGDRIAFFMPNCAELAFCYLACFKLGAVAVPLNARYKAPEVSYALGHSEARVFAVHASRWPDVRSLDFDGLGIRCRYVAGAPEAPPGTLSWDALLAEAGSPLEPPRFGADAPLAILYTSGTTSRPKGVTYTHATMAASNRIQIAAWQLDATDVQLATLSFAHAAALSAQILPGFALGGTNVLLDEPSSADIVEAIRTHACTRLVMLPAMLEDFVEHLEHHPARLPSLRSLVAGGDSVPLQVHERFHRLTGLEVTEVWGMTECLSAILNPPFGAKRPGSVGRPAPEVAVRLVDVQGLDVPDGGEGELLIRSPALAIGYWKDPEGTAAAIVDGWLHTGDLARRDEDGFYWFCGRIKEVVVRAGSKISPLEVEEVIAQHPAVHRVGVVGIPDARLGQVIVACVMLQDDEPAPDEAGLRRFTAERIAAYKVPAHIVFLPELPLSPVGKIDRHRLLARLLAEPGWLTTTSDTRGDGVRRL